MLMRLSLHSHNHTLSGRLLAGLILTVCSSCLTDTHAGIFPFLDDFNQENGGAGTIIDYQGFANWDVTSGSVDLKIDGHGSPPFQIFGDGMFVDTVGVGFAEEITSKPAFNFVPGTIYSLTFYMSGNQRASSSDLVTVTVGDGSIFQESISLTWGAPWQEFTREFTINVATNAKVCFLGTGSLVNQGMLLDDIELSAAPDPALSVKVLLDNAVYYSIESSSNLTYQLFGRDSPFTNDWFAVDDVRLGDGETLYGFERGTGPAFLPSRAWEIKASTDETSLSFDGVNDFAFRAHDSLLDLAGGMTIEAWVKPTAPGAGSGGTVLAKAASPAITAYRLGTDGADQAVFQIFNAAGTAFVNLTSSATAPPGTWTHLAATYNGSTALLYMNGLSNALVSASGTIRTSALAPLGVGGILGTDSYAGLIDEIRVWDHARSASEISAFQSTKLDGSEAGLVAYWQLDEPGSQTAVDSTANNLDLVLGDSCGPDATDPVWTGESYPGPAAFEQILAFGSGWFSVYWDTQPDSTYTLESATNFLPGDWTTVLSEILGTGGEFSYFQSPLLDEPGFPNSNFYRVHGPPLTDITDGLVGRFPLNNSADDTSGNEHHGTVQGGVTFVNDPERGPVASFDGVDGFIDYGDVADFEILDRSMSFSVWFKTSEINSGPNSVALLSMVLHGLAWV